MRQFFEAYADEAIVSPPMTLLPRTTKVVGYALSRSLSPALIAEYQAQLLDKQLLQAKLHAPYQLDAAGREEEA